MPVFSHRLLIALAACTLLGGAAAVWERWSTDRRDNQILSLAPEDVLRRPDLVSFAIAEAKPVYRARCASCHGADLKGNVRTGAPDLSDSVWLYDTDSVTAIERTLLYGIRSRQPKARNVAEMPAFGLRGLLTPAEIGEAVQYVLALSKRPNLAEAAVAGRQIFLGKGMCYDCHGPDGSGSPDYGAPNLTVNVWNNGGDQNTIYHNIYYGLAHVCPAWYGVIPLERIRALAIWLHSISHATPAAVASARAIKSS
jgi:cytochrome c oxidase cbb3-type subunit 3